MFFGIAVVKFNEFRNAIIWNGYPEPSEEQYTNFVSKLHIGNIFTKQEAAMALAQFLYESNGLVSKREAGCDKGKGCPDKYSFPECDIAGQEYYGRGYLKIRGCKPYVLASLDLYTSLELLFEPDLVAKNDSVAWDTSFWFWRENVHTKPGLPFGLFGVTTRAINGNLECDGPLTDLAKKRFEVYKIVRKAFGYHTEANDKGCYL